MSTPTLPQHEVLVVGAGFGGIAAGVKLRKAGIDDFVIVDNFSGTAGELKLKAYDGATLVLADVTGDGEADFSIMVRGSNTVDASDFVL